MASDETASIDLRSVRFEKLPLPILNWQGMEIHAFRFDTGIEAVRITTPVGEATVLPFKGQQIWDATFSGRRLTMGSMFKEPQPTQHYLETYGAFLLHCGISGLGAPGPDDNHPLHAEMPNAPFQTASLLLGRDAEGPYLTLDGGCEQIKAFAYHYLFRSQITLRPRTTHFDIAVSVANLRPVEMDLMYLAHINFRPVDCGRLIDTILNDRTDIEVRDTFARGFKVSAEHRRFIEQVKADPAAHRTFVPGRRIDPELVMFPKVAAGADGWAHGCQLHPDGQADFVSYKTSQLPAAVRWTVRMGDQEAIGVLLPSTSGIGGYTAQKAKGDVVVVPPGGHWHCSYRCGALAKDHAAKFVRRIDEISGRPTTA